MKIFSSHFCNSPDVNQGKLLIFYRTFKNNCHSYNHINSNAPKGFSIQNGITCRFGSAREFEQTGLYDAKYLAE
jgi:hypothetical protein